MSDSIPSASADHEQEQLPANAEDRKAAAALSALNTDGIGAETGPKPPSAADQEALGKAMSRLEIAAGQDAGKKRTASETAQGKEGEVVRKKTVRVAADDVALLVDQLDLNKIRATELLKAHDGDAREAIKAFITAVKAL